MNYKEGDLFEIVGVEDCGYLHLNGQIVSVTGKVEIGETCSCGRFEFTAKVPLISLNIPWSCGCDDYSFNWKNLKKIESSKLPNLSVYFNVPVEALTNA